MGSEASGHAFTICLQNLHVHCTYNIKKGKMWYDCKWDKSPQEIKMTHKLTTIGHLHFTASGNKG